MFSLFYGFWKYLFKKDEYFILILGLDNAGKTTFLERIRINFNPNYKGMNLSKITATVGLNIGKIEMNGVVANFWDLGGQLELRPLWDKVGKMFFDITQFEYYAESHALIYVIDSSDIERIEDSKKAFEQVLSNEALAGVPLLIVSNKNDIAEALSLERIKEIFRPSVKLIGRRDCHTLSASALKGVNINEGIEWLVQCIKRNSIVRPPYDGDG